MGSSSPPSTMLSCFASRRLPGFPGAAEGAASEVGIGSATFSSRCRRPSPFQGSIPFFGPFSRKGSELFDAHLQATLAVDLVATMATMVPEPHVLNLGSGMGGQCFPQDAFQELPRQDDRPQWPWQ